MKAKWLKELEYYRDGTIVHSIRNIRIILENDKNIGFPYLSYFDFKESDIKSAGSCMMSLTLENFGIRSDSTIWQDPNYTDEQQLWTKLDIYGLYEYMESAYGITDRDNIDIALVLMAAESQSGSDDCYIKPITDGCN